MDKKFEQFKKIVLDSELSDQGKLDIVMLFSRATDDEMDAILGILRDNPQILPDLYGNFAAKKKAMIDGDEKAWDDILREEEKLLSKLAEESGQGL